MESNTMNEIEQILNFLKNPRIENTDRKPYKIFINVLLIDLFIISGYLLVLYLLNILNILDISDLITSSNIDFTSLSVIMISILFGPLLEELIFRYYLINKKYNPINIFVVKKFKLTTQEIIINDGFATSKIIQEQEIWNNYLPRIFYFSTFCFTLFHLYNYNLGVNDIIYIPLLLLPPFFVGVFAGYLRIRINFFSAVMFHVLHNGFVIAIMIISSHQPMSDKPRVKSEPAQNSISIEVVSDKSIIFNENYLFYIQEIITPSNSKFTIDEDNRDHQYFIANNIGLQQVAQHFAKYYKSKRNIECDKMLKNTSKRRYNIFFVNRTEDEIECRDTIIKNVSTLVEFPK